jgi:hypothetical protein
MPQIILNTFGGGDVTFSSYSDISYTTLGNLGQTFNNTDILTIPYCKQFTSYFHVWDCFLDKKSLAMVRHHHSVPTDDITTPAASPSVPADNITSPGSRGGLASSPRSRKGAHL